MRVDLTDSQAQSVLKFTRSRLAKVDYEIGWAIAHYDVNRAARLRVEHEQLRGIVDALTAGPHCPSCGESDLDRLIWADDERVTCASCGREYRPQEQGREWHD